MNKASVVIHPEIAAAVLRQNLSDVYFAWLVAKRLDIKRGGSGKIEVVELLAILTRVLGIGEKSAYAKIAKGAGIFWSKPGGKNWHRVTVLAGIKKVVEALDPTMPRTEPFRMPVNDLLNDSGSWNSPRLKKFLVACVASRHVDRRPMSLASIMEHTGLSESTVRNFLKASPWVVKVSNYQSVYASYSPQEARRKLKQLKGNKGVRLDFLNGMYTLIQQMPNSYLMPQAERLPLRHRPEALKALDQRNSQNLSPRKYMSQEHTQKYPVLAMTGLQHKGHTKIKQGEKQSMVFMWQGASESLGSKQSSVWNNSILRSRILLGHYQPKNAR